jgi:hypothetical protein
MNLLFKSINAKYTDEFYVNIGSVFPYDFQTLPSPIVNLSG